MILIAVTYYLGLNFHLIWEWTFVKNQNPKENSYDGYIVLYWQVQNRESLFEWHLLARQHECIASFGNEYGDVMILNNILC